MALFDPDLNPVPRLPASKRYTRALAHDTGTVSKLNPASRKLPPRRKGDPSGEGFDESRLRVTLKAEATPHLAVQHAHKPHGDTGKNPITGDPIPVAGVEGSSVNAMGDYPREYATAEPSPETVARMAATAEIGDKIALSRAEFRRSQALREAARLKRYGW